MTMSRSRRINPYICVAVAFVLSGVWLLMDSMTWVSGSVRYMIAFERLFNTPPEIATTMRWVEAASALTILILGVGIPAWLGRRHCRKAGSA